MWPFQNERIVELSPRKMALNMNFFQWISSSFGWSVVRYLYSNLYTIFIVITVLIFLAHVEYILNQEMKESLCLKGRSLSNKTNRLSRGGKKAPSSSDTMEVVPILNCPKEAVHVQNVRGRNIPPSSYAWSLCPM